MKNLIKTEELAMFLFAGFLFWNTNFDWWWFPALLLVPDVSMIGYLIDPKIGAYLYNFVHHKGLALLVYGLGFFLESPVIELAGIILFAHSSMDRLFGYGLKYNDSFYNTHLGKIGKGV
ncbi:DUF4260 domain-containing protein [Fodinibius sp. Rm-B-1B1-1]|uniref:DUF4260 domain-containing protein n=1 Tax=Fodinibius alkaliphilus TaxID=3140241 RepID=UPI00315A3B65